MAEPIDNLVPGRVLYPWSEWADGRAWRAVKGTDFFCSVESFRSAVYAYAERSGLAVTVTTKPDDIVEFQFRQSD